MSLLSRFYQREDFHQCVGYARVMESIGWSSIPVSGGRLSVRQLGPVSLAKMQRPKMIDLPTLYRMREKLKIFHLIIEPACMGTIVTRDGRTLPFSFLDEKNTKKSYELFRRSGFSLTSEHYAHSKTAIIDLAPPIDAVVGNLPSKTRYNVKIAHRENVRYSTTLFSEVGQVHMDQFFSLHHHWSSEKRVTGYSDHFLQVMIENFSSRGWLISSYVEDQYAGGMFVLIHDGIGYYFYTCSSQEGRAHHVPTGMTYEAFKLCQEQGADIFDFCSVYDERYPTDHPRWKGFTAFKQRFSPTDIYYPSSFSRWL